MLSFLRARASQSPSQRSLVRELSWSGHALTLSLDPALRGERIALDLDQSFFTEGSVDSEGVLRFAFPFAPLARGEANLAPRRGRDGAPLVDAFAIRFGQPGIVAAISITDDLG